MSSSDWWAKKLQQQQPPAPPARTQSTPQPPSQSPMTPFEQPQVSTPETAAAKAHSASQTQTCPDCGSGNYFSIQGAKARCYECGYPMEQSGSKYGSLTGARVEGDTKGARGNDSRNNYNPQNIIGRID